MALGAPIVLYSCIAGYHAGFYAIKSEKELIQAFGSNPYYSGESLYYEGTVPMSAAFYSRGMAKAIETAYLKLHQPVRFSLAQDQSPDDSSDCVMHEPTLHMRSQHQLYHCTRRQIVEHPNQQENDPHFISGADHALHD